MVRFALCLLPLLLVTVSVPAQSALAGEPIRSTSSLVLVPALVTDPSGQPVTRLGVSDFKVTDDGVEQKVFLDTPRSQPLALVILMQTGSGASAEFESYRKIEAALDYMIARSPRAVALVTFDSRPEVTWDFPARADGLIYGFTHPTAGDKGATVLDAVNYAIDLLEEQPKDLRRVILLLSQPKDVASTGVAEDVVRRLGESNTSVYSVRFGTAKVKHHGPFHRAADREREPPQPDSNLSTTAASREFKRALEAVREDASAGLASLSGGEQVEFEDSRALAQELSLLTSDLSSAYTLSFRPSSKEPGFHTIKVEAGTIADRLNVTARSSYWLGSAD